MRKKFDQMLLPPRPDLSFEKDLWSRGVNIVAGIDEAGRGAWAGPVYAAIVVFPPDRNLYDILSGVDDSKKLTPLLRSDCADQIKQVALAWNVGAASSLEIDKIGILPATILAMKRAIQGMTVCPQHLLVDFLTLPDCLHPQTPLVKGDARSLTIAAASILAKTSRDREMVSLGVMYPGYGFERHKGYGTTYHRSRLDALGPSPIHRTSFQPLRSSIQISF
jgi:ribonuclease HII